MRKTLTLTYPAGLHARPSTEIVKLVRTFNCKVSLIRHGKEHPADSVIELLSCGVQPGEVEFEAEGPQAEQALIALEGFIHKLNTELHW